MKKYSGLLGAFAVGMTLAFGATAQVIPDLGGPSDSGEEESGARIEGGDRRFYLAPMFSYTFVDKDRKIDRGVDGNGLGGTLALGKRMTSGLNLELTGFYQRFNAENGLVDANLIGWGAAMLVFPSQTVQNIYGLAAVHQGSSENHPTTPNSAGFDYRTTVFDTGVGYVQPLSQWLGGFEMAIRGEVRYRMDAHTREQAGNAGKKHFYEPVVNVGVVLPLGKLPVDAPPPEVEVVEAAEEPPPPADTDGDGVLDDADQCPETPAGTAVNENGCPAIVDADGDGIPDDKDTCPATPGGTAVDETGCPPKEAGCRAPVPGEPINLEGCATGESVVLKGVNFEVNSSRLTANAKAILNQVGDSLSATAMKVEIGGHTDAQGSDAFNQKLSERRAQAVHDYLVARGIDSSRLTAKGYGESQPVDTNETPEGRELNRRVEMKVIDAGAAQ